MTKLDERSDLQRFLRSWLNSPLRVGAIAPSGGALARLITSEISEDKGPILELGAGTGVFTRAILDRGVDESDLTIVEYGSDFASLLDLRFPRARVLWMDASQLARYKLFEPEGAGAVISGLPLLSMSKRKVITILSGAFMYLRTNGALYQFTYGPSCPVPRTILDRLGLKAVRIGWTMRNLPPASVYRITRRRSSELQRNMSEYRRQTQAR
ncbi:class I SAM-dependent methyltransferase [Methylophaga lonarensis]|uniref:class I SAM-dependent methyltransferase n=1 Tax=Methylophaga lonarensis TaxID=999151 RepID=UPI003D288EF1